ncbi:MAG: 23S rRNA (pseudouridine(1915)-N(3))-methyltransferase RlmH [Alphaproteobacteria bacterium]|nr:23S rRNA (pseudouridine(1915)-N(3))-methyltransferase RlmH [Alphaproteobacteria bacterium]MBU6471783.1 23S rRNA (pseudouridine(1915)-N(3))-methyltransferase RlmH [Alphaproteobacteria bacterium]MDE2013308.1 23S rRNA (pseudouridine(1915)-N(3))-methyltransferase RlmH [Alphaproteobacteria bacterium]MDE2072244.1 23S rRNA (pseudouridine(1915)-N(3))-methyltransferase RlmH [Alphaproteobacteria bacterium]MDE2350663.1 23S rRNA (pseudouridine(1915)-N(3))-methyltransferase RlmH [Alphaproteobacteria bact
MRLLIIAVGNARGSHEGALGEDFTGRARAMGKQLGFSAVSVEEVAVSKLREARARIAEEGERLARRIPEGAHVILLDARGKGMTSEAFAEMLAAMRDAGARDLVFVIGGPDGLDLGPSIKAGRSLAFGPQTWPHMLVRAMLSEQIYRAFTILAGHPYHRA